MELRNLRALVEVARQGGFSQAARTLFLSQPSVSKAVRQLEEELDTELFVRLGEGARLTEAGELVMARAVAMLAEAEHMRAELAEMRGFSRANCALGCPYSAVPDCSRRFSPPFAAGIPASRSSSSNGAASGWKRRCSPARWNSACRFCRWRTPSTCSPCATIP